MKKEPVVVSTDKNITKYLLPGDITLIINHNKLNDIVAMQIISKGGNYIEKKAGTGAITASVMMKGTKKYSSLDLSQVMEQNGIKIAPANGSDYFSIAVKTTRNDLPLTFDLLNEIINNASFEPQEIARVKAEQIQNIQKNRDMPASTAFEEFKTAIWTGTPLSLIHI